MRTLLSAVLLSTLALSASVRADEPARPSSSDKAAPVVAKPAAAHPRRPHRAPKEKKQMLPLEDGSRPGQPSSNPTMAPSR